MVTGIPGAGDLRIVVTSPDPKRAAKLFNGLRIINSANGCAVDDRLPKPTVTPGAASPIARPDISGGSVCAYQDGWLVGSSWLNAAEASAVAAELDSGPPGLGTAWGVCTRGRSVPPGTYWLVHLRVESAVEHVWVYPAACNRSGAVTQEGRAVGITQELADRLGSATRN